MDFRTDCRARCAVVQAVRRVRRLMARLVPERACPIAHGRAEYSSGGSGRSLSVSLGGAPAGTRAADLLLEANLVATVPVSSAADSVTFVVDTCSGAAVPELAPGASVTWLDAATGDAIASGVLRRAVG